MATTAPQAMATSLSSKPLSVITEILGQFKNASNTTLLARTDSDRLVVYKPEQGERPLWDFAAGTLAAREVLTYQVSRAAGLDMVPETFFVEGPLGPGSAQHFIEIDPEYDAAVPINEASSELWPIATLDLVVNNADRKAGHIIADTTGRLWCIDHGVTFHAEAKLRTVLWNFAGLALPPPMVAAVRKLIGSLSNGLDHQVRELLGNQEAAALAQRASDLLIEPFHPLPPQDRPPIPWPVW